MATMKKSTSSSCFTCEWAYDVFLSFRGEDTRTGITGNLYNALREKGINAFMDDQKLSRGEQITPALVKAIQQSRIAIVIFSENYASSTFCLEELVMIMKCIKYKGRLVWPLFYRVDPSDVRHQKGSYAVALAKCERKTINKVKVKRWRLALQEAANLSGWHFKHGYEYEFIRKIIQEVSERVNRIPLYVANYPVGLESRVQELNSLLDVESNDRVHMVGIYGIGGIGKTTLACAVFNCIADQFESLCFLADIRENSMKHGLVHLQETLLFELVGEKDVKLWNVNKGIPIIKSRLCQKKILLILDDVDRLDQLKALAGGLDWFGAGSRVIITTRDKHLLRVYGVARTYEVEGLNHEEALELFSWNAFKRKDVIPCYLDISERVILHSNGLPLSLEIIGSDLFGKTVSEWKSALEIPLYFCFPGSAIPSWFNHCCSEPSLSLWFRNKFPEITLCVVGGLGSFADYEFDLIINGSQQLPKNFFNVRCSFQTNHITLFEYHNGKIGRLYSEDGWNHAQISLREYATSDVEWMGVHVHEQKTSMADILFINPGFPLVEGKNENVTRGDERSRIIVRRSPPQRSIMDHFTCGPSYPFPRRRRVPMSCV